MNKNNKDILNDRLASGEISLDEYRQILAEIDKSSSGNKKFSRNFEGFMTGCFSNYQKVRDKIDEKVSGAKKVYHDYSAYDHSTTGDFVFEFEDLLLFENVIVHENITRPISDITSVRGWRTQRSFNFVPSSKNSWVNITFLSKESILIIEDSTMLKGKRHDAIMFLYSILRERTFKQRLNNSFQELIKNGEIKFAYDGKNLDKIITLKKDGTLSTPRGSMNLKIAKSSGTFGIGTEWNSLIGISRRENSGEVIISEKKGLLGSLVPRGALSLEIFIVDMDIAHFMLIWMADPQNTLD